MIACAQRKRKYNQNAQLPRLKWNIIVNWRQSTRRNLIINSYAAASLVFGEIRYTQYIYNSYVFDHGKLMINSNYNSTPFSQIPHPDNYFAAVEHIIRKEHSSGTFN